MAHSKVKVFSGKLIKLFKERRLLPNKKMGYFEKIEHPGASLVVPFIGEKIVFIRQYRAVINRYIWELPAGTLAKNETPLSCAGREVAEETGYQVKGLKKIGKIFTTPGFSNEVIHIYKAKCGEKRENNLDVDEVIEIKLFSRQEIRKLFENGNIVDAKTIAALSLAKVL